MERFLFCLIFLGVYFGGCRSEEGRGETGGLTAEMLLFGGEPCRQDADCASGRCSLGMCAGLLMNAIEAVRGAQHERLRQAARDQGVRERLAEMLVQVLHDSQGDAYLRARAALALSALPLEMVGTVLAGVLEDPEEPVRFQAGRSLHRLGDSRGTEVLRSFLKHESAAVRALARHALDRESAAVTGLR